MKLLLTIVMATGALCCAQMPKDLTKHPLLQHYVGKWTAEGTLKNAEGQDVPITEEWEGKGEGEGSFLIEGTRTLNGDTQSFKWTITHNPSTDSLEAILSGQDGNALRFEGQFSEVTMQLELKAVTGNGNGSITVLERLQNGDKDVIESKVTFLGDNGEKTLEGTIIHKRVKAP